MANFYKRFENRYLSPYSNRNHSILPDWKELISIAESFNDLNYAEQQAKISPDFLVRRLIQLELTGGSKVLDLGCGYGQWSLALSTLNDSVTGIDLHSNRIKIAKLLAEATLSNTDSLNFLQGEATDLTSIEDSSLDSIFCFGVFMFLDPKAMLSESFRVLKPGGKLYICTNSAGWWSYLLLTRGFRNRHLFKSSLRALVLKSRSLPSSFTRKKLKRTLEEFGFGKVKVDLEGVIGSDVCMNTYKHRFLFMPMCIESIATKPGLLDNQKSLESVIKGRLDGLTSKSPLELSFLDTLADEIEYVGRAEDIFADGELHHLSAYSQLETAHKFVGDQIFHDIDDQILDSSGNTPMNLGISLALRSGRCGVKARALADIVAKLGWKSGVIVTGSHVLTWVEQGSEYLILDADIFAPGVISASDRETPFLLSDFLENNPQINRLPNSLHIQDIRNQRFLESAPESIRKMAIPSTVMNSPVGKLEIIQRIKGRDFHLESISVNPRTVEFLEIPPVVMVDQGNISFKGNADSKYLLLGCLDGAKTHASISELTQLQELENFSHSRKEIPPQFTSIGVVEFSGFSLNPGMIISLTPLKNQIF